jgi:hypothetical protein
MMCLCMQDDRQPAPQHGQCGHIAVWLKYCCCCCCCCCCCSYCCCHPVEAQQQLLLLLLLLMIILLQLLPILTLLTVARPDTDVPPSTHKDMHTTTAQIIKTSLTCCSMSAPLTSLSQTPQVSMMLLSDGPPPRCSTPQLTMPTCTPPQH